MFLWNCLTDYTNRLLLDAKLAIRAAVFCLDDKAVAAPGSSNEIVVCDLNTFKNKAIENGHSDKVQSLFAYEHGNKLASSAFDGTIRIWDLAKLENVAIRRLDIRRVYSVVYVGFGDKLAYTGVDGLVRIGSASSDQSIVALTFDGPVSCISFNSKSGMMAAGCLDSSIQLCKVRAQDKTYEIVSRIRTIERSK